MMFLGESVLLYTEGGRSQLEFAEFAPNGPYALGVFFSQKGYAFRLRA